MAPKNTKKKWFIWNLTGLSIKVDGENTRRQELVWFFFKIKTWYQFWKELVQSVYLYKIHLTKIYINNKLVWCELKSVNLIFFFPPEN